MKLRVEESEDARCRRVYVKNKVDDEFIYLVRCIAENGLMNHEDDIVYLLTNFGSRSN